MVTRVPRQLALVLVFWSFIVASKAADRYWVRSTPGNWNDPASWSTSSGGSGGASVPGASDKAIFNALRNGNCTINAAVNVKGIHIRTGYSGTVAQGGFTVTVGSDDFRMESGTFLGGTGPINFNVDFFLDGGLFRSTSGLLSLSGDMRVNGGQFAHNNGTVIFGGNGDKNFQPSPIIPIFYNVRVQLQNGKKLQIGNGDTLQVMNRIDLINGKLHNGLLAVNDTCVMGSGWDPGTSKLIFNGAGNTFLFVGVTAWSDNDIVVAKTNALAQVVFIDSDNDGLLSLGTGNKDLIIERGIVSFEAGITAELAFGDLVIKPNGTLKMSDNSIRLLGNYINQGGQVVPDNGTLVFAGTNNQSFTTASTPVEAFHRVEVALSNGKDLSITSGDTLHALDRLVLSNGDVKGGALKASGSVVVSSGFDGGDSPLVFGGDQEQTFDLTGATGLFEGDIVIAQPKARGVQLLSELRMLANGQKLVLIKGYLRTSLSQLLTIGKQGLWTGGSDSSFVEGPLQKIGKEVFTFPVGDARTMAPLTISRPNNDNDAYIARYHRADPNGSYDVTLKDASLNNISRCEYWTLRRAAGSSNVSVSLSYAARSCGIGVLCDVSVARWDGAQWRNHGNGGFVGNLTAGRVVSGALCNTPALVSTWSGAMPFTLGSISLANPLPIELLDFGLSYTAGSVIIEWSTATEMNNDHFIVQRSLDAMAWEVVGEVPGAGTSMTQRDYLLVDDKAPSGINYYRLSQVDHDGTTEYFNAVAILVPEDRTDRIPVFPNPTKDRVLVPNSGMNDDDVVVMNIAGQVQVAPVMELGAYLVVDLGHLPDGVYLVRLSSGTERVVKNSLMEY